MSFKDVFKKIWLGVQVAEPYMQMAGALLPPPFGLILKSLDALIEQAELRFPAQGTGTEKAEYFTEQGLKVMELLTGKNVDNPQTRLLVGRIGTIAVQIKNIETQIQQFRQEYHDVVQELTAAIDGVKEAAKDDVPVAPTA